MVNINKVNFEVPNDSRLAQYTEQLRGIMKRKEWQDDFNNFNDKIFFDCCTCVKNHVNIAEPNIRIIFVNSQREYDQIVKDSDKMAFQREKPKETPLGFTSRIYINGYLVRNDIFLNFVEFPKFMLINLRTYVFNLVSILVHEILHCYYGESKNEQATYNLQWKIIESFLGLKLPEEIKQMDVSKFYH